jgi:intracellular sulfur oxidation DsrE/DsrF family protein
MKFHENPSSGNQVVTCGQTDGQMDRHDEAKSPLLQFCKCVQKGIQEKGRQYIKIQKVIGA